MLSLRKVPLFYLIWRLKGCSIWLYMQKNQIYKSTLGISTFTSVHPSLRCPSCPYHSTLQFLQVDHKTSLIKVEWKIYILALPQIHKAHVARRSRATYLHYIIRGDKAKLLTLKLTSLFHCLPSFDPKQLCALENPGCTRKGDAFLSTPNSNC